MAIGTDELVRAAVAIDLIDSSAVESLRQSARRNRADLLDLVTTRGRFPRSAMYQAVAEVRGLPFINADTAAPASELVRRLPAPLMRRCLVLPVRGEHSGENGEPTVVAACADPDETQAIEAIQRLVSEPVRVALADPEALKLAINRAVAAGGEDADAGAGVGVSVGAEPVALLDHVLKDAFLRRASDIHFEPQQQGLRIRLRTDGRLHEYLTGLGQGDGQGVISRVKVLSGLDIAEQRAPQDGGFTYQPPSDDARPIDIRVATTPTRFGERATLRLLGTEAGDLTLEALGMPAQELGRFRDAIQRTHGMVLITGPTGSGKTTTLYAALREIDRDRLNIMTVEDPIEYVIPGISQMHVGGGDKLTFAGVLRSFLRHDPDVLMVGEIRDHETADVALKAAMTGHLVFSTLHTNDACSSVTRLIDIGCAPFLISSTLLVTVAQRLVRTLCPRCRRPRAANDGELKAMGLEDACDLYEPVGCASCLGNGYRGRTGLFETFWVDEQLQRLITRGVSDVELRAAASDRTTLRADGYAKARAGVTTLREVLTATVEV